jgi:predicted P-loop ATPase
LSETLLLTFFNPPITNITPETTLEVPWTALPDFFRDSAVLGEKGDAGYVVAATLTGDRCEANSGPATAIVVDYEPPPGTTPEWDYYEALGEYVAHTTASHDPRVQERWRVFVRLAEPLPAELYRSVRYALDETAPPGAKVRSIVQPAYLPTTEIHVRAGGHAPLAWADLTVTPGHALASIDPDRKVDPESVPDEAHMSELVSSIVGVWPRANRHDASFALGGVLARGTWPAQTCLAFAERVLDATGSDIEDGLECVQLSLQGGNGAVFGVPKLIELLASELEPNEDEADDPRTIAGLVVDGLIAAIRRVEDVPPPPPKPITEASKAALRKAGFDPDVAMANLEIRLKRKPKGGLVLCAHNVREILRMHPEWFGVFGYDELAQAVTILREPPTDGLPAVGERWTADDYLPIQCWFGDRQEVEPSLTTIIDSVKLVARQNGFHPVRTYLEGLPAWDGIDRNLSTYLGAEQTPLNRASCEYQLRAAIARVLQLGTGPNVDGPGCQADDMVVLEGAQGIRKSTAIRALCPNPNWFYESRHDMSDKDFAQDMLGKWLCEIPEVDKIVASKDDSELKAMLSKRVDRYRKSYGRDSQDHPRQVVFFGTTNRQDYLRDETGNRRYLPVACGTIDIDGIVRDRDQMWAQALYGRRQGLAWWLPQDLLPAARAAQADRLEQDVWVEHIRAWVESQEDPFTLIQALAELPGAKAAADLNQSDKNRMGRVLRSLGAENHSTSVGGVKGKFWYTRQVKGWGHWL